MWTPGVQAGQGSFFPGATSRLVHRDLCRDWVPAAGVSGEVAAPEVGLSCHHGNSDTAVHRWTRDQIPLKPSSCAIPGTALLLQNKSMALAMGVSGFCVRRRDWLTTDTRSFANSLD